MNWKTTVSGLVGALAYVGAAFGFSLSPEVQNGIIVVTLFLVGLFAKDAKSESN